MGTVTIASPFEVWSRGMEAILRENGLNLIDRWVDGEQLWSREIFPGSDLLILAWRYVSRPPMVTFAHPLNGLYDGKIILVLEQDDEFTADDFVAFDVEGLILSSASTQEFNDCIASVSRGGRWVDPAVRLLIGQRPPAEPHWETLSSREREVARLAASGMSNKLIARELDLSDGTVKMHMHHILAKLRLCSRVELFQVYSEQRLATPHSNGRSVLESEVAA